MEPKPPRQRQPWFPERNHDQGLKQSLIRAGKWAPAYSQLSIPSSGRGREHGVLGWAECCRAPFSSSRRGIGQDQYARSPRRTSYRQRADPSSILSDVSGERRVGRDGASARGASVGDSARARQATEREDSLKWSGQVPPIGDTGYLGAASDVWRYSIPHSPSMTARTSADLMNLCVTSFQLSDK